VPQVGSAAKAEHQGRRRKRHIYEKDADDKPVRQIASGQLSAVPNDKWDENLQREVGLPVCWAAFELLPVAAVCVLGVLVWTLT